jgi:hypothetical protein
MKKLLTGLLAMLVLASAGAFAQTTVSVEGLSESQVKAIQAKVEEVKKEQRAAIPELSMMDKAVELGRVIGSGLVATARELGIAANDFAKSDLGRVVMYILIWKYLGQDILGIVFGIPFMIAGVMIGLRMIRSARWETTAREYATTNVLWGLFTLKRLVKSEQTKRDTLSDTDTGQMVMGYVIFFLAVVAGLFIIF